MRIYLLLMLLLAMPSEIQAAGPRFVVDADGSEVVSDFDEAAFTGGLRFSWAGDPFLALPGYAMPLADPPSPPTVQATIAGAEGSVAVVNDAVVKVGDRVQGRRVRKIGADYVLLEAKGSIMELNIQEGGPGAPAPSAAPALATASGRAEGRAPASVPIPEGGPVLEIKEVVP
jgi:hypothetical protein